MTNSQNIISANDLRTGLNVYLIQEGDHYHWTRDIRQASTYDEAATSFAFERAKQDVTENIVVDCVIVPVDEDHNPVTVREKIRATGPSSHYGPQ